MAKIAAMAFNTFWFKALLIIGPFVLLGLAWQWLPLESWSSAQNLTHQIDQLGKTPQGFPLILLIYAIGCVLALPILFLIVTSALLFGPTLGFIYAIVGTAVGAASTYGVGYLLGHHTIRRYAGSHVNRLNVMLAKRGILASAMIRWIPIAAPFTVVNMVAGASHIRFWDYMLGTLLGMLPITLGLTVFADGIANVFQNPQPKNLVWILVIIAIGALVSFGLHHWVRQSDASPDSAIKAPESTEDTNSSEGSCGDL
jgi:uncharacterized membrane protein YdjX (TVP38/TMEM64 family)